MSENSNLPRLMSRHVLAPRIKTQLFRFRRLWRIRYTFRSTVYKFYSRVVRHHKQSSINEWDISGCDDIIETFGLDTFIFELISLLFHKNLSQLLFFSQSKSINAKIISLSFFFCLSSLSDDRFRPPIAQRPWLIHARAREHHRWQMCNYAVIQKHEREITYYERAFLKRVPINARARAPAPRSH